MSARQQAQTDDEGKIEWAGSVRVSKTTLENLEWYRAEEGLRSRAEAVEKLAKEAARGRSAK
jgi:hypothetical protein